MVYRVTMCFLGICLVTLTVGCASKVGRWAKYPEGFEVPQLRFFYERGSFANGEQVVTTRLYGMKVLEDGSEQVVWSRTTRGAGLEVGIRFVDKETVWVADYLVGPSLILKLDLRTGECLEKFQVTEENKEELRKQLSFPPHSGYSWRVLEGGERPGEPCRPGGDDRNIGGVFPNEGGRWPDMDWQLAPIEDIQIRIFVDKGVYLPDGSIGDALQIYGMRVLQDGSEKVVWRKMLDPSLVSGQKRWRTPRILLPDSNTCYVRYEYIKEILKFDRKTGELVAHFKPDASAGPEFPTWEALSEKCGWGGGLLIDVRPMRVDIEPGNFAPQKDTRGDQTEPLQEKKER